MECRGGMGAMVDSSCELEGQARLHVRGPYYLPESLAYIYANLAGWTDRLLGRAANVTPQVLQLLLTPKVHSSAHLRELGCAPQYPNISLGLKEALPHSSLPPQTLSPQKR